MKIIARRASHILTPFFLLASAGFVAAQEPAHTAAPLPDVALAQTLARAGSVPLSTVLTDLITKGAGPSISSSLAKERSIDLFGLNKSLGVGGTASVAGFSLGTTTGAGVGSPADATNSRREFLNFDQSIRYAPIEHAVEKGYTPRTIEFDHRFESNVVKLVAVSPTLVNEPEDNKRIWSGISVPEPDPFRDAVALTGNNHICSGTLIAPDTVVTAGHCYCDGVLDEAIIGRNILSPSERIPIDKAKSAAMRTCDQLNSDISLGDIALVKLSRSANVPPRKIAPIDVVREAAAVRAVGFGRSQDHAYGFKYQVNIVIASPQCDGTALTGIPDSQVYRCRPSYELVAASLNRDTCAGDSGGPIYVLGPDASLYLVGLTSRAVDPNGRCGPGGVYVLMSVPPIKDWLVAHGINPGG